MKYISAIPPAKYRFKIQPYPGLRPYYNTYQEAFEVANRLIRSNAGKIRTKGFKTAEELIEKV